MRNENRKRILHMALNCISMSGKIIDHGGSKGAINNLIIFLMRTKF